MAKKRRKKGAKPFNSFLIAFAVAGIIIYLAYSAISSYSKIADLNREINIANSQLQEIKEENESTKDLINTADKDDLVERIARERLGYVKPNERIFYDAG